MAGTRLGAAFMIVATMITSCAAGVRYAPPESAEPFYDGLVASVDEIRESKAYRSAIASSVKDKDGHLVLGDGTVASLFGVPEIERGLALVARHPAAVPEVKKGLAAHCETLLNRAVDRANMGATAWAKDYMEKADRCLLELDILNLLIRMERQPVAK